LKGQQNDIAIDPLTMDKEFFLGNRETFLLHFLLSTSIYLRNYNWLLPLGLPTKRSDTQIHKGCQGLKEMRSKGLKGDSIPSTDLISQTF